MICLTKKCEVPLLGQAWFNPKSISEMVDKYNFAFDSQKEDALVVYLPTEDIKFY